MKPRPNVKPIQQTREKRNISFAWRHLAPTFAQKGAATNSTKGFRPNSTPTFLFLLEKLELVIKIIIMKNYRVLLSKNFNKKNSIHLHRWHGHLFEINCHQWKQRPERRKEKEIKRLGHNKRLINLSTQHVGQITLILVLGMIITSIHGGALILVHVWIIEVVI